jgi:hypothetical protein
LGSSEKGLGHVDPCSCENVEIDGLVVATSIEKLGDILVMEMHLHVQKVLNPFSKTDFLDVVHVSADTLDQAGDKFGACICDNQMLKNRGVGGADYWFVDCVGWLLILLGPSWLMLILLVFLFCCFCWC